MPDPGAAAVTHDGAFHADDVLAAAMILRLHPGIPLVRSRDPAIVADARIAFDVGAAYDPDRGRYDHHMRDRPLRPDGVPYAACGLVWRHHGAEIVARRVPEGTDPALAARVVADVDAGLVRSVDAVDNGIEAPAPSDFACLVGALCPLPGEGGHDEAFGEAVRIAGLFLDGTVDRALAAARGVAALAAAAGAAEDRRVATLDRPTPWRKAAAELGLPHLLYVVHPNERGDEWMCVAVPDPAKGPFGMRMPLPGAWGGLRDEAFSRAAGVPDGVFCHPGLFVCAARSRASAERLARAAADGSGTVGAAREGLVQGEAEVPAPDDRG